MRTTLIPCAFVYPSGFPAQLTERGTSSRVTAEPESLKPIYDKHYNGNTSVIPFSLECEIIALAKEVFGDSKFEAALQSNYLKPIAREFLFDCVNFALNGVRRNSMGYYEAMKDWDAVDSKVKPSPNTVIAVPAFMSETDTMSVNDIIYRWCKQPDGVGDLLRSLRFLLQ